MRFCRTAGATILKLTYGYNVESPNDRFVVLADTAMEMFSTVTTPGAFMVDIFPICELRGCTQVGLLRMDVT